MWKYWFYIALAFTQCVEPYPIPSIRANSQFLVVDAFLNATDQHIRVRLTRTVNLNDSSDFTPELNARVFVNEQSGGTHTLLEMGEGFYESNFTVSVAERYQLEIKTPNETFQSDFIPVLQSPAIDSVNWRTDELGVSMHVSTHDPSNQTRFYLWKYVETWEFRAAFQSSFIFENGSYIYRLPEQDIFHCWHEENSSEILIGSTNQLNKDIVSDLPLLHIPNRSEKLLQKYSILVEQIAITGEAYDFWQQLKKNTESLGTLFDPQPSQIKGNIQGANGQPVIGYFMASTTSKKRMTVALDELPSTHRYIAESVLCEEDTVLLAGLPKFEPKSFNLVVGVYNTFGQLIGFKYSTHYCTDCLLQGGTRTKPEYW